MYQLLPSSQMTIKGIQQSQLNNTGCQAHGKGGQEEKAMFMGWATAPVPAPPGLAPLLSLLLSLVVLSHRTGKIFWCLPLKNTKVFCDPQILLVPASHLPFPAWHLESQVYTASHSNPCQLIPSSDSCTALAQDSPANPLQHPPWASLSLFALLPRGTLESGH